MCRSSIPNAIPLTTLNPALPNSLPSSLATLYPYSVHFLAPTMAIDGQLTSVLSPLEKRQ